MIDEHALRGIGELDSEAAKFVDDAKIDRLLQVEQGVDFRLLDEVRQLELQAGIAEGLQVAALEAGMLKLANDALEELGYAAQLLSGRGVSHPNRRERPLLGRPPKISHTALQEIGVRHDDLLAGVAAQTRGLDADAFHRSPEIVDQQHVAHHEGFVQCDRQRGEQIPQDVLQRQGDRHAADAEAGEQRRDVDADVLERQQDQQGPDQDTGDEVDDVQ